MDFLWIKYNFFYKIRGAFDVFLSSLISIIKKWKFGNQFDSMSVLF